MMEKGRLLKVTMELALPADATDDEVEAWMKYSFHVNGSIKTTNPLIHFEPEPFGSFGFDWEDTGMVGAEEKFDEVDHGDGKKSWNVRYKRERAA